MRPRGARASCAATRVRLEYQGSFLTRLAQALEVGDRDAHAPITPRGSEAPGTGDRLAPPHDPDARISEDERRATHLAHKAERGRPGDPRSLIKATRGSRSTSVVTDGQTDRHRGRQGVSQPGAGGSGGARSVRTIAAEFWKKKTVAAGACQSPTASAARAGFAAAARTSRTAERTSLKPAASADACARMRTSSNACSSKQQLGHADTIGSARQGRLAAVWALVGAGVHLWVTNTPAITRPQAHRIIVESRPVSQLPRPGPANERGSSRHLAMSTARSRRPRLTPSPASFSAFCTSRRPAR